MKNSSEILMQSKNADENRRTFFQIINIQKFVKLNSNI